MPTLFTKEALAKGLKELLQVKPLSKISVKDITEHCGISRNTFYYHFQDKYELINWIFRTDMLRNVNSFDDPDKLTESFVNVCKCLYANRRFYMACFQYVGQNSLYDCLYDYYYELWRININTRYLRAGFQLAEGELDLIAKMKAHSLVGILSDWVKNGMRDNYMRYFEEVHRILEQETASYSMLAEEKMMEQSEPSEEESSDGKEQIIC